MAEAEREIAAAYDRWSGSYDSDRNATRDLDGALLRDAALPLDGARVLEIGCGTGRNTGYLARRAAETLALDFSPGMLERARRRCAGLAVRFAAHDIRERWPADDGAFDVVVVDLVLEHVEAVAPVFAEAARVLRPGGVFFACELHPEMQRAGKQANFTDPDSGAEIRIAAYPHSVAEFLAAGEAAGFILRRREDRPAAPEPPRLLALWLEKPKR